MWASSAMNSCYSCPRCFATRLLLPLTLPLVSPCFQQGKSYSLFGFSFLFLHWLPSVLLVHLVLTPCPAFISPPSLFHFLVAKKEDFLPPPPLSPTFLSTRYVTVHGLASVGCPSGCSCRRCSARPPSPFPRSASVVPRAERLPVRCMV